MSISSIRNSKVNDAGFRLGALVLKRAAYQSPGMGNPSFGQSTRTHAVGATEDETNRTLPSIIPATQTPESMAWTKYGLHAWTVGWFWGGAAVEVAVHVQAELSLWLVPAMPLLMSRVSKYGPRAHFHLTLYAQSL
jgi:hypothetical protein